MEGINPVEWFVWIYGKCFQGHAVRGGIIICLIWAVLTSGIVLILWIRAVDKYKEEHGMVNASPVGTAPANPAENALSKPVPKAAQVTTPHLRVHKEQPKIKPLPIDTKKTQVQALDPNDPNYEYLKRGCKPPTPGTAFYICNGIDNDIHDNDIAGPAELHNMVGNRIWNNRFNTNKVVSPNDLGVVTNLAVQYQNEHPGSQPDQQWVDWINARLKDAGKQFQVSLPTKQ